MNHTFKLFMAVLLLCGGFAATTLYAQGEAGEDFEGNQAEILLRLNYASKDIWRGLELSDEPVLLPYLEISNLKVVGGELTLSWLGHFNVTDYMHRNIPEDPADPGDNWAIHDEDFARHDWRVSYSQPLLAGELELGWIQYYYPMVPGDDYAELYAKLTARQNILFLRPLKLYVSANYEYEEADGWYIRAGVGTQIEGQNEWRLQLDASLGWATDDYNKEFFGVDDDGTHDFTCSIGLEGQVVDNTVYVKWMVSYTTMLDDGTLEEAIDTLFGDTNDFWFSWIVTVKM